MGIPTVVMMMPWRGLAGPLGTIGVRVPVDLEPVVGCDLVGHMLSLVVRFCCPMKYHRRHEGDGEHQAEGADQLVHEVSQEALHTVGRMISQRAGRSQRVDG